ncbi:ME53 [Alphabaculovirus myunipunctae]|uniref:ME53 n=1 Tax=Mythimna unipuncta nucleopolyhedrovirus TaxID=447897 RepID=A0A2K9VS35_9ABAC|nr:ME53 [Mythimna unipuncta nucleopolyhedrovirus]AUV65269.1 ME53 [Mythimna unipuncta nucleopolyhedrovirus]
MSSKTISSARISLASPSAASKQAQADKTPRDLRPRFLSVENMRLLKAISRFAVAYVKGVVNLNDYAQMHKVNANFRGNETKKTVGCQGRCNRLFSRDTAPIQQLHVAIDTSVDAINDPARRWQRFRFVCQHCLNYYYDDQFVRVQLYPRLSLVDVERLCELGFVTRYIFPIALEYTTVTTSTKVPNWHDFFSYTQGFVRAKRDNEHISSISLRTYGRTLFEDTDKQVVMHNRVDESTCRPVYQLEFKPKESSMMAFLDTYNDHKLLTYFYVITKRVYKTMPQDYVVYFPIKCTLYCRQCTKDKMFKRTNPILYCSVCGFTDAFFFSNFLTTKHNNLCFDSSRVQIKVQKPASLLYYDMSRRKDDSK